MLIGQLKVDMSLGTGVTVVSLRRRGEHTRVILSTGTDMTLHKTRQVADLFVGHLPARTFMRSPRPDIKDIRATSRDWRGENVGRKGERFIAKTVAYDRLANDEAEERRAWTYY